MKKLLLLCALACMPMFAPLCHAQIVASSVILVSGAPSNCAPTKIYNDITNKNAYLGNSDGTCSSFPGAQWTCVSGTCTISGNVTITGCLGLGIAFDNSATANQTLKNSAGTYVIATTTDTATPLAIATKVIDATHVCVAGSGSQATVQVDAGGATALHYALQSTTTNGKVKDSGATTVPASGCWLGVFAANASASTNGTVIVNPGCAQSAAASTVTSWANPTGVSGNGALSAITANNTRIWGIVIPNTITSSAGICYNVTTADNTGNLYDIGLYDVNANLIAHIGATAGTTFSPSTGIKCLNWTGGTVSISAGKYYFAMTGNAATALVGGLTGAASTANFCSGAIPTGGTTSGGALNGSGLITIPADSWAGGGGQNPNIVIHN